MIKKLKTIFKEDKECILVVIIVASVVYALLSFLISNWTWYGQFLAPSLGVFLYVILQLRKGD